MIGVGGLLLDTLVTGLPMVPVFLGLYTVFRLRQDLDLTLDGSFALGGAVCGVTLVHGVHPVLALAAGALAGGLAGLVTAGLHLSLRIPVLLAGLVMSIGLFSVTLRILGTPTIGLLNAPSLFSWATAGPGRDRDVWTSLVLGGVIALLLTGYALFLRTEVGLALRASGANARMSRSQGVNEKAMLALALFLANALAAFGAGLLIQTQGFSDVNMGVGTVIAGVGAVLLGELFVRPTGSRVARIVLCVLVGTLAYRLILVGALRAGLPAGDLKGVTALTLVAAVAAQLGLGRLLRRRRPVRPVSLPAAATAAAGTVPTRVPTGVQTGVPTAAGREGGE
jgi:putative tryptophan/tyrosine transport system permease protein